MIRSTGTTRWLCGGAFATLIATAWAAEPVAPAGDPPRKFYVEDIKAAMADHIAVRVDADGVFHLRDDKTGEMLALKFVRIHDPVRKIDGRTYFACTDFHVIGAPDKLYDLDFWLRPDGDRLRVYDEKVHKEPRHSLLYGWYKHPRYTFVKDKVVLLY
ncbi:MAG: hypothetical protein AB7Q01_17150 [Gammaproteobacteria bacterium]